ncbi:hypothetical protein P692DRAFT_20880457 [Suillus brevipes Sb2]|nr:hypothetical protein P692DRAFT_20880457 [Suillus brevipes Sb2]
MPEPSQHECRLPYHARATGQSPQETTAKRGMLARARQTADTSRDHQRQPDIYTGATRESRPTYHAGGTAQNPHHKLQQRDGTRVKANSTDHRVTVDDSQAPIKVLRASRSTHHARAIAQPPRKELRQGDEMRARVTRATVTQQEDETRARLTRAAETQQEDETRARVARTAETQQAGEARANTIRTAQTHRVTVDDSQAPTKALRARVGDEWSRTASEGLRARMREVEGIEDDAGEISEVLRDLQDARKRLLEGLDYVLITGG